MQNLFSGKDEEARVLIAQRTGRCLVEDALSAADHLAAEKIAYELAKDAVLGRT